ncbi:MAG: glyoxylate/hydroxypyruvate reductase A [Cyanobacteria bacterium J06607_6]
MKTVIPLIAQLSEAETAAWLAALKPALPACTFVLATDLSAAQRATVEVAIVANPDPADLLALPRLRWVQSLWAGVERLIAETAEAEFAIVKMSDPQLAATMAEAVLAWTLYLHRDMPRYQAQQRAQIWQQHFLPLPSQRTIGLLGLGDLGTQAAERLVQQGFTVYGWSRTPRMIAEVETFSGEAGLNDVLQQSQIVICLLPLTKTTHHRLNHQTLALLPPGASLINFARGAIVDTAALVEHLDCGHLSHAVLDVFDTEPLPPQSPLWHHPQITVLPHIAAPTNKQTAVLVAADNINQFLSSDEIPPSVDRDLGY